MNGLNVNEHERQSIRRVPTTTKTDALTSAKAKMLLISKHYLKVAPTKPESNFKRLQPIAHSSEAQTIRSYQKQAQKNARKNEPIRVHVASSAGVHTI